MIQSNKHGYQKNHSDLRHPARVASEARHEHAEGKNCDCSSSCKCGCQDGKPCTCEGGCACGPAASGIISGICFLLGACFISGSIIYTTDYMPKHAFRAPMAEPVAHKAAKKDADLDKAIAAYIQKNPEAIISSLESYERKQRAQQQPRTVDSDMLSEILSDKTNHVMGDKKGSFVIIEFFDYNCGYCKMMNKKIGDAMKKAENVRWILMDAPIFGDRSELIARYAFAANKQGKFAEYHTALGETNDKSEDSLKEIGKKLGLDVKKLEKDANSDAAKAKLAKTREYTQKLGLSGVPMFIINGKVQTGAFPDEQLEEYLKQAKEMKKSKKK